MRGVLLINLGTPEAPTPGAVRRYLRQFLMDPHVIGMNSVARFLLVCGIIAPLRGGRSARAYQKIWTERGSPLLFHTVDLASAIRRELGPDYRVEVGMRYGRPSIAQGIESLMRDLPEELIFVPLYPQFALSSTQTAVDSVHRALQKFSDHPRLTFVPAFYNDLGFINAMVGIGNHELGSFRPDHVLFSFHGLPRSHIKKTELIDRYCYFDDQCCKVFETGNPDCYRAHCYHTVRLTAAAMGLVTSQYTMCFQSRLGRGWLQPYTDEVIQNMARAGKKRLAVFCPSFVCDCLETLEEIAIRGRQVFRSLGGEELRLIPSLNSSVPWVSALVRLIR